MMQGFWPLYGHGSDWVFKNKLIKFDARVCSYTIIRIFVFKFLIGIYRFIYIYVFFKNKLKLI